MEVGCTVEVLWKDGKNYRGKVLDAVGTFIKVRYNNFKKRHDEWIDLAVDGKKVKRPDELDEPSGSSTEVLGGVVQDKTDRSCRKRKEFDGSDEEEESMDSTAQKKARNTSPLPLSSTVGTEVVSNHPSTEQATPRRLQEARQEKCKFCSSVVDDCKIECQVCEGTFHADVLCLGVEEDVVCVLKRNDNGAISYNCTECRLDVAQRETAGPYGAVLKQLICTVGEVVKILKDGKGIVQKSEASGSAMQSGVSNQAAGPQSSNTLASLGTVEHRNEILGQVRELREREKRADSIVIRGLGNISLEEVNTKFESMCQELQVPLIPLTGLTKIGAGDLYRARIANKEQRQSLLLKVSALKNSQTFSRVYINRDLTKQQREEVVRARRARLRSDSTVHSSGQPTGRSLSGNNDQNQLGSGQGLSGNRGTGSNREPVAPVRGRPCGGASGRGRGRGGSADTSRVNFNSIPHVRNF